MLLVGVRSAKCWREIAISKHNAEIGQDNQDRIRSGRALLEHRVRRGRQEELSTLCQKGYLRISI